MVITREIGDFTGRTITTKADTFPRLHSSDRKLISVSSDKAPVKPVEAQPDLDKVRRYTIAFGR